MENRLGEPHQYCFRASRFSNCCGNWYFHTRACVQLGPFETRQEAEIELIFYLRRFISGYTFNQEAAAI